MVPKRWKIVFSSDFCNFNSFTVFFLSQRDSGKLLFCENFTFFYCIFFVKADKLPGSPFRVLKTLDLFFPGSESGNQWISSEPPVVTVLPNPMYTTPDTLFTAPCLSPNDLSPALRCVALASAGMKAFSWQNTNRQHHECKNRNYQTPSPAMKHRAVWIFSTYCFATFYQPFSCKVGLPDVGWSRSRLIR